MLWELQHKNSRTLSQSTALTFLSDSVLVVVLNCIPMDLVSMPLSIPVTESEETGNSPAQVTGIPTDQSVTTRSCTQAIAMRREVLQPSATLTLPLCPGQLLSVDSTLVRPRRGREYKRSTGMWPPLSKGYEIPKGKCLCSSQQPKLPSCLQTPPVDEDRPSRDAPGTWKGCRRRTGPCTDMSVSLLSLTSLP